MFYEKSVISQSKQANMCSSQHRVAKLGILLLMINFTTSLPIEKNNNDTIRDNDESNNNNNHEMKRSVDSNRQNNLVPYGMQRGWQSPCNDKVALPHVTKAQAASFSSLKPSTPSQESNLQLAHDLLDQLHGARHIVSQGINQTEAKYTNLDHISSLKQEPSIEGVRHPQTEGISEQADIENVLPVVSQMYNTLTRIAIFLDSIRLDLSKIREQEERTELAQLLRRLEQGDNSNGYLGIYSQLCDMYLRLPALLNHALDTTVIPAQHRGPSKNQAQVRDRNYRILSAIHSTLIELIENSDRTLPEMEQVGW